MEKLELSKPINFDKVLQFICRGCTMKNRELLWDNFKSSIATEENRHLDNSYLIFKEEPTNEYDSNAIMIMCKGEFFGVLGYVGKEFTLQIKDILSKCSKYRIDMFSVSDVGKREISLILRWK